MEKLKLTVYTFLFLIAFILIFSLTKSWINFDRGIELQKEKKQSTLSSDVYKKPPHDEIINESLIIWNRFLYYPIDLDIESENLYQKKTMNHAKNLVFVDLVSNKIRKIFQHDIYIWDYFVGQNVFPDSENGEYDSQIFKELEIKNHFIIIAMPIDTNTDGFLSKKDLKRVYIYDPFNHQLKDILPKNYFLEKLIPNSPKEELVLLVKRYFTEESKKNEKEEIKIFHYNVPKKIGFLISNI